MWGRWLTGGGLAIRLPGAEIRVPAGKMIAPLAEYGVKCHLQKEDYLEGLANLHKVW